MKKRGEKTGSGGQGQIQGQIGANQRSHRIYLQLLQSKNVYLSFKAQKTLKENKIVFLMIQHNIFGISDF